ncbi:MAG TPA: exodeoxyribonuclease VII large subunit [Thiothrix sp.]|nr:exodeoxyribonuclease VII large subunit [Thiothrix sp.]
MKNNSQRTFLTVSELNAEVDLLLKETLPLLWIEGEISNLARPTSGHIYFSLKDNKAQVRCAMFRNQCLRSHCNAENGLKVQLQVRIGLYQARGEYQLIVEKMEEAGTGALQKAFEALKIRLSQQGLFAIERKKSLPNYPTRIGIITSPTGAALRDIIHVLNRRCPHIPLLIYPVAVQGEQAVPDIINALQQANSNQQCDVLLLARGGGSIEDLWAFNEAAVAHAINESLIPIITGIGHEIDFTIADFVSDQRAPTPSAAAELATPNKKTLLDTLYSLNQRLRLQHQKTIAIKQEKLIGLNYSLKRHNPTNHLKQQTQYLDELDIRLKYSLQQFLTTQIMHLQTLEQRLLAQSPQQHLAQQQKQLQIFNLHLHNVIQQKIEHQQQKLCTLSAQLQTISPLATLQRGYAIVQTNKKIIRSVKQLKGDENIIIRIADGNIYCKINELIPLSTKDSRTNIK